jgi:hypothetical protein
MRPALGRATQRTPAWGPRGELAAPLEQDRPSRRASPLVDQDVAQGVRERANELTVSSRALSLASRARASTLSHAIAPRVSPVLSHARHSAPSERDRPRKEHACTRKLCAKVRPPPQRCGARARRRQSPQPSADVRAFFRLDSLRCPRARDLESRIASAPRGTSRYLRPTVSSHDRATVPARRSFRRFRFHAFLAGPDSFAGGREGGEDDWPNHSFFPPSHLRARETAIRSARGSRAPPKRFRCSRCRRRHS